MTKQEYDREYARLAAIFDKVQVAHNKAAGDLYALVRDHKPTEDAWLTRKGGWILDEPKPKRRR